MFFDIKNLPKTPSNDGNGAAQASLVAGDAEEGKTALNKKAAKKEAIKLEKLKRQQEAAAASATIDANSVESDPLAKNYGDVLQSKEVRGKNWTKIALLGEDLKDKEVVIRGRIQTRRAVDKNIAFLVLREEGFTVQCVLTVTPELISRQMVKFASSISRESYVDIHGMVSVPKKPITGASQQVEVQVRKIYCISKALPNLPINVEDAAPSEAEIEKALQEKKHIEKKAKIQMASRPHFFKAIMPGSNLQLTIPNGFFKNMDAEKYQGEAILKSCNRGSSWRVKMNGLRFQEGWSSFAKDHDLHIGDFLVFQHEGEMVFNVIVFDATACEKEYLPLGFKEKEKQGSTMKQDRKNFGGSISSTEVVRANDSSFSASTHAQFTATIQHYNIRDYNMYIPLQFLKSNGLTGRCCMVTLIDEKQREWIVMLKPKNTDFRAYIRTGWREFSIANNLKEGDICTFKLISTGLKPVMEVAISYL